MPPKSGIPPRSEMDESGRLTVVNMGAPSMISIKLFEKDNIGDVVRFENDLREQEPGCFNWDIGEEYVSAILNSFSDAAFKNSISLLAYEGENIVGRIDTTLIASHFDGSFKAYLDWICVLKSHRHRGVAQSLLSAARRELKKYGVYTLIALIANNDESLSFYRAIEGAVIRDEGIRIDI
jgi:ribosomal protein S18 acetylase RimI-like enzyme